MAIRNSGPLIHRQVKAWHAVVYMVIALAGGGGTGTWMATAQVDERLREQEIKQAEIRADVKHIGEEISEIKKAVNENRDGVNDLDKKLGTAVEILRRVEQKVR